MFSLCYVFFKQFLTQLFLYFFATTIIFDSASLKVIIATDDFIEQVFVDFCDRICVKNRTTGKRGF